MLIRTRAGWELPESAVTPEHLVAGRRRVVGGALAGAAGLVLAGGTRAWARPAGDVATDTTYAAGRALTPEAAATTYNNFSEFGPDKDVWPLAQKMPLSPWVVRISGLVEKPQTLPVEDLVRAMPLEQRVLRHRCVEAWAMTVPWTGFALAKLVELARPLPSARYVSFTSAELPGVMPGLHKAPYPWPYREGLTMQEATNPLAFMATGLYGKGLPPQSGGPLRLVLPWKYGFKSAKSVVSIGFTDTQPATLWQDISPTEYGFWANVNPDVPHPRWSQASERLLGSDERVPTQLHNGYGEFVASLYPRDAGRQFYF
ncbi:MAG: protein-methionine-sulfoxide reductase catalytic subunit MsrP [Janthinobacterium lividum]